ncbi:MAG TPA: SMC-Scp complex subunit ScpB [Candidatus Paceibacterota bacterium]
MDLSAQLEAILFWKGEPIALRRLAEILQKTPEDIAAAAEALQDSLKNRGVTLVRKEDEIMMGTSPEMSTVIESLTKEELVRDLGKAGLETLSIILYRGPASRSDIDYIRGVNSQFIIRNLLVRGLIEKVINPKDNRSFLYKPSFELLSYLGLNRPEDLPEYQKVREDIETQVAANDTTPHE